MRADSGGHLAPLRLSGKDRHRNILYGKNRSDVLSGGNDNDFARPLAYHFETEMRGARGLD